MGLCGGRDLPRAIDEAIERWMDRRIGAAIESELGIPGGAALPDRLRVQGRGVARRSRLSERPVHRSATSAGPALSPACPARGALPPRWL